MTGTWQILGLTYGQEWKSMTEDIPGSRGHPVTGKVSCGSQPEWHHPSQRGGALLDEPQHCYSHPDSHPRAQNASRRQGEQRAGNILPERSSYPPELSCFRSWCLPQAEEGHTWGVAQLHTRQMQRCAAICEKRSQAWLVPLWTVSKLPLWQQRCCRETCPAQDYKNPPLLWGRCSHLSRQVCSAITRDTTAFVTYQEKDTLFPFLMPRPHLQLHPWCLQARLTALSFTRALSLWKTKWTPRFLLFEAG